MLLFENLKIRLIFKNASSVLFSNNSLDKMQSYIPDSARSSVHQIDYEQYWKYKEKQESPEQKAEFDIAEDKLANISDIEPIEEDLLTDEILDQELFK